MENRLELIRELAEKIHESYQENYKGFMNEHVERIIKLTDISYNPKRLYKTPPISKNKIKELKSHLDKLTNEEYINPEEKLVKEESELFWRSFDYYYHNSSYFKIEADNILGKLYVNNKNKIKEGECFCGGDNDFKVICKECDAKSELNETEIDNGM